MIELKHLRLLEALGRLGTLSAAARELGYSQPAATQQLQAIERGVGTPLVVRARTGVRLTDAGAVLVRHGAPVLEAVTLAEAEVAAIAGLRAGRVRVAAFPSAASALVPDALAEMIERHPGVGVSLSEAEPPEALAALRAGETDLAIVFRWSTDDAHDLDDLAATPLLVEDVRLVDHVDRGGDAVSLPGMARARWIAGCPKCRGHLVSACEASGFTPEIAFESDDYVAMQSLAARGLGVALVPELVLTTVRVDGLQSHRVDPPTTRTVSAVTTPEMANVPGVRAAVEVFRAASARLAERSSGIRAV